MSEPSAELFCYRHPQIQTGLRCNRCNKPICPKCVRRIPVGFRCPDCVREQEDKFYTGTNTDYILALIIALPLALLAAGLLTFLLRGFFLIVLLAAPALAGFIAEAVRWGVRKRRSRYLGQIVAGCIILGAAPFLILALLSGNFFALLVPGIFGVLGAATALARLR